VKYLLTTHVAFLCRLKCLNSCLPWVAWSFLRGLVLWLNRRIGKNFDLLLSYLKVSESKVLYASEIQDAHCSTDLSLQLMSEPTVLVDY
jgi:hypothetical protein